MGIHLNDAEVELYRKLKEVSGIPKAAYGIKQKENTMEIIYEEEKRPIKEIRIEGGLQMWPDYISNAIDILDQDMDRIHIKTYQVDELIKSLTLLKDQLESK